MIVIANADSGTADALDEALAVLGDVEVVHTGSPEELDDVIGRDDLLVVAGGDGSLHAVVQALHRNGRLAATTLALVPLGTGNDFARGVDLPLDPAEAAQVVTTGVPTAVDLLVDDDGDIVVNNVHVGAGAEAARAAVPWKKALGPIGYVVGAGITALRPPTLSVAVTVDGDLVSRRSVLQVALGNAPFVGGGTELTPEASPTDGQIEIMVSSAVSPAARAAYALHLRRGEHHRREDVLHTRGRSVTVEGEPFHVSADGELAGPFTTRTWRIEPGALTVILPAGK